MEAAAALTDHSPIVIGVLLTLMVVRELVPLVLRLQGQRADSRRPPPPPPPFEPEASGEWQALGVGELTRRLVAVEQDAERREDLQRQYLQELTREIRQLDRAITQLSTVVELALAPGIDKKGGG